MNSIISFIKGVCEYSYGDSIEIIDTKRIIIENIKSILHYSEEIITISLGNKIVVVSGAGLKMNNYTDNNIVIDGLIKNISFE